MNGKLIIISAPSGTGKSTLIERLLKVEKSLIFSISATCRLPRGNEKNGVEYYFLSKEEFENKIAKNEFIEYEEVYNGCYYGTLRSEVERIIENGMNVIFDIDVVGGVNVKKQFAKNALSIFIAPPSKEKLRERLINRNVDALEMIEKRLEKADYELTFANKFDVVVVNDNLETAEKELIAVVQDFLH